MSQRRIDNRGTIQPGGALIPLRGPSGRLYGMFDPQSQTIEFRHGARVERIDLRDYQQTPTATTNANGS